MKKQFIILILLVLANISYSQVPIGLSHDVNGFPLNGYFDILAYSPIKKITYTHYYSSYEVGYYYEKSGNKISGLIKFEDDKIFFKKQGEHSRTKITPEEINSFVIGTDSFFTITNYYFKNKLKEEPEFVQYITEFNGYTIVKHFHFTSGIAQQYGGQPAIVQTYLVKHKDGQNWDNFTKDNYKERALKYFGNVPLLANKITTESYKGKDILRTIKTAEYYNKLNNSEPIWYDKYWQETRDIGNAEYSAKIVALKDSIWTFEYYKDSLKIYQANYSSFSPNTRIGNLICFYPNGQTRQIVTYVNNKATEVKTYRDNGMLHAHYKLIENKVESLSLNKYDVKYIVVNDTSGNNIISENTRSSTKIYDNVSKNVYTSNFIDNELSTFYRMNNSDTVFQYTNPDYYFNIQKIQKKFDEFMLERNYDGALSVNAQGVLLVNLLIDNKGCILEGKLLNSIHSDYDRLVNGFVKTILLKRPDYRFKVKVYKRGKIKHFSEVVIPFEFNISRYYREPNINYYNDHLRWQQQMMNQHMHQQMINNIRPPSMPGRF